VDQRVQEILDNATDIQRRYVRARLVQDNLAKAARAIGIHRTTPHHWQNLDDLEEAVALLYDDVIEATKMALEDLSLEAVATIGKVLKQRNDSSAVAAARAVWDRIGLPAMSNVDVTSKGQAIKAVVYIPDNERGDRD